MPGKDPEMKLLVKLIQLTRLTIGAFVLAMLGTVLGLYLEFGYDPAPQQKQKEKTTLQEIPSQSEIKDGIHVASGLAAGEGLEVVLANCTGCHSAKMVIQNRATREGWESMIRWMQQTQNLWDLGSNEDKILDYLARHYAPQKKGRRQPLANIEWYELEK